MTPTDTLPADIARSLVPCEPCVVAVVKGHRFQSAKADREEMPYEVRPPTAWTAVAGAKCRRCRNLVHLDNGEVIDSEGGQWVNGRWVPRWMPFRCPNPLCRDGDLLHELRAEEWLLWYRTVPARIEVVPVKNGDVQEHDVERDGPAIIVLGDGTAWFYSSWGEYAQLDPAHVAALKAHHGPAAGWVGKYAIVATVVER